MSNAIDKAIAMMPGVLEGSIDKLVKLTARDMVAEPWRICKALNPYAPRTFPPKDTPSLIAMLAEVRGFVRVARVSDSRGWQPSIPEIIVLRGAEEALVQLIAANGQRAEDAARRVA